MIPSHPLRQDKLQHGKHRHSGWDGPLQAVTGQAWGGPSVTRGGGLMEEIPGQETRRWEKPSTKGTGT